MEIKVKYINPTTKRIEKRSYKLAPGESESEGVLFIFRALNFVFNQQVRVIREQEP